MSLWVERRGFAVAAAGLAIAVLVVVLAGCAQGKAMRQHGGGASEVSRYDPSWSPDGRRIAFLSDQVNGLTTRLYLMRADGTGLRPLASLGHEADTVGGAEAVWSPDGRRLALSGGPDIDAQAIYLVGLRGGKKRRLTPGSVMASDPAWSPDGRRIAFDGGAGIYVINADGSGQRRLTRPGSQFTDFRPVWSPNGRQIAFVRANASPWKSNADVFVMSSDGRQSRRLTHDGGDNRDPAWSPDGRKLVFSGEPDLYLINVDGSRRRRLTSYTNHSGCSLDARGNLGPGWSPDGRKIAFYSDSHCTGEIDVINPDGSRPRHLTPIHSGASDFAWSPDGREITFALASGSGLDTSIDVINAGGGHQRQLTP